MVAGIITDRRGAIQAEYAFTPCEAKKGRIVRALLLFGPQHDRPVLPPGEKTKTRRLRSDAGFPGSCFGISCAVRGFILSQG